MKLAKKKKKRVNIRLQQIFSLIEIKDSVEVGGGVAGCDVSRICRVLFPFNPRQSETFKTVADATKSVFGTFLENSKIVEFLKRDQFNR